MGLREGPIVPIPQTNASYKSPVRTREVQLSSVRSDDCRWGVFDDRVVMRVRELPPEFSQAGPSIHGSPRHSANFTDTTHPTGDLYQTGRVDERSLVLRLETKLRNG